MDEKHADALRTLKEATSREYRELSSDGAFKFSCHKRLSCFATCCSDINIFLTPYDVLRMKRAAGVSSGEFLWTYTISFLGEQGLPVVMLKMMEDARKSCPFVSPDGCKIYQDRPWACRMYPLAMASSKTGEDFYFIMEKEPTCLGFKEGRSWTVEEWKKDQAIDSYDEMNDSYKEITFHDYFQSGKKLSPGEAKMFYTACYNLDEFKRFLFETRFFDIYDVESEVVEKIREDEEELLNFGFRWIRFGLFWEDTMKLKDKALDELLRSRRKEFETYLDSRRRN